MMSQTKAARPTPSSLSSISTVSLTDYQELTQALRGHDVVVNAARYVSEAPASSTWFKASATTSLSLGRRNTALQSALIVVTLLSAPRKYYHRPQPQVLD
jgi:hypothetical protein